VRKIKYLTFFIAVLIGLSCASNKKINDMKHFINEAVRCTEEFIIQISESVNENDAVFTIETFTKSIIMLEEKSSVIKKKYPDIDLWFDEPPAELENELDKLHIAEKKFKDALKTDKVRELRKDSKVQSAFMNLINELEKIKFFQ